MTGSMVMVEDGDDAAATASTFFFIVVANVAMMQPLFAIVVVMRGSVVDVRFMLMSMGFLGTLRKATMNMLDSSMLDGGGAGYCEAFRCSVRRRISTGMTYEDDSASDCEGEKALGGMAMRMRCPSTCTLGLVFVSSTGFQLERPSLLSLFENSLKQHSLVTEEFFSSLLHEMMREAFQATMQGTVWE